MHTVMQQDLAPSVPLRLQLASWLLHRLPLWTGLARVTNLGMLRRWCRDFEGEIEVVLRGGVSVQVNLADFNGRMLYLFGQTDPKVVFVCNTLLRTGDVFLDVGANHGEVGLICASGSSRCREVHLFEPIPSLAKSIGNAASRHALVGVQVHAYALGLVDGMLPLQFDRRHTGKARLMADGNASSDALSVPIREVRSVLRDLVGDRPFGAKVDIEGGEEEVVPPLLEWPSTRFVVFEWEHLASPESFLNRIERLGYSVYGLEKRVFAPRLVSRNGIDKSISDVVAVRQSSLRNDLAGRRIASLTSSDIR